VVEEQNSVKQITFILSVELIGEIVEILKKQKHSLPSPFAVLLNH
jgi:hypothetical protein